MLSVDSVSNLCISWDPKYYLTKDYCTLTLALTFNNRIPPNGSKEHVIKLITFICIASSLNGQDKPNPALIGYISKQDGVILLTGDCFAVSHKKKLFFVPYNKSL